MHVAVIGTMAGLSSDMPAKPIITYDQNDPAENNKDSQAVLPEIRMLGHIKQFKKQDESVPEQNQIPEETDMAQEVSVEKTAEYKEAVDAEAEEAVLRYQDMIKKEIEHNRRYPLNARRRNVQGVTDLEFSINRSGCCSGLGMIRSSGSKLLDDEALDNIKRSQPFPSIPSEIKSDTITIRVAIVFSLN